jgi:serine/threonine-protein kinase
VQPRDAEDSQAVGADPIDPRGATTTVIAEPGYDYAFPRISPDGRRLAVAGRPPDAQDRGAVRLVDLATGAITRLTSGYSSYPEWSPDGRHVIFLGAVGSTWQLALRDADLRDDEHPVPLPTSVRSGEAAAFLMSRDGRTGVLVPSAAERLYLLDTVQRTMRPLTPGGESETQPRLSPDCRWLAFTAVANGRADVFVRPFPGPGARVQISPNGGTEPVWSRDGHRLYYRAGGRILAASVAGGALSGIPGQTVVLEDRFELPGFQVANYDVAPDGSLYLVLAAGGAEVLTVTVNWLDEARAKLAGRRGGGER